MRVVLNKDMQAFPRLRTVSEALSIEIEDLRGPILTRFGQIHRRQQSNIFATQGATSAGGAWAPLNERYKRQKRGASKRKPAGPGGGFNIFSSASALSISGRGKILVLTGDMKRRFTQVSAPEYVQQYVPTGNARGVFRFGAHSDVAAAHRAGNPSLAPRQSYQARRVFGGIAQRLPIRDMISKTPVQREEFNKALTNWYIQRVRQVIRALRRLGKL